MSIATKKGDSGATALMYNRRVSKCHPRVEAYGTVDELTSALGVARASAPMASLAERLQLIQKDMVVIMGELATGVEDLPRYATDGYPLLKRDHTAKLDQWIAQLEQDMPRFRGWATPGGNMAAATLDLARAVCRRAERRVCALQEEQQLQNPEIIVYLNRLSDLLWLLARHVEPREELPSRLV
jgi:cob(I)alamin adenosyltransferase